MRNHIFEMYILYAHTFHVQSRLDLRDTLTYQIHDALDARAQSNPRAFSRRFFPAFGEFFALKIEYMMILSAPRYLAVCNTF